MSVLQAALPTRRLRVDKETTQSRVAHHCVVTQAAQIRLCSSPYFALRSLTCANRSGRLHLFGTVPTYFMKQMAQETIRPVDGVEVIVNLVIVRKYG